MKFLKSMFSIVLSLPKSIQAFVMTLVLGTASTAALADTTTFLPPAVASGFTTATSDWTTLSGYIWPLVILVTFTLLTITWFKKGARKSG